MAGVDGGRRVSIESTTAASFILIFVFFLANSFGLASSASSPLNPDLGSERVVFQTNYGDIEFGFFPDVAPKTVEHMFKLVRLGCYNTNHFFRVDRGFVAQVADVAGGRIAPMNDEQRLEAAKTVVGEFSKVKHVRGILSMGRYSDPDSASSSFSILLGDAPHLDGEYAIFGRVTKGEDTLSKLEELPTRREGIFVMPTERISIMSTYYYGFNYAAHIDDANLQYRNDLLPHAGCPILLISDSIFLYGDTKEEDCQYEKSILKRKLSESAIEIERQRLKCFS